MSTKKFTKIDKRHKGYSYFEFYTDWFYEPWYSNHALSLQRFYMIRDWCWQTWGSSKEINNWITDVNYEFQYDLHSQNEHWSWGHEDLKPRIYLRTEKELSLYLLKWGNNT